MSLNPPHGEMYSIQHYVMSVTCDRSVVFSTNKTDCHDITKILLKVLLNTIKPNHPKLDLDVIHSGYKYHLLYVCTNNLLIHVIIVYHWHWTGRIRGTLSSDQLIWKCNALLGHTKLISCSWDTWPEKLGRVSEILFGFFPQKLNFWKRQILTQFFFVDNVVWIYIIVQTASVQCPRLHLLWQGCLLYICNSRGTLVLFCWWIGNRVKLNRLCVSYCFNIWFCSCEMLFKLNFLVSSE